MVGSLGSLFAQRAGDVRVQASSCPAVTEAGKASQMCTLHLAGAHVFQIVLPQRPAKKAEVAEYSAEARGRTRRGQGSLARERRFAAHPPSARTG